VTQRTYRIIEARVRRELVEKREHIAGRGRTGGAVQLCAHLQPSRSAKRAAKPRRALGNSNEARRLDLDALCKLFSELPDAARHHPLGVGEPALLDCACNDLRQKVKGPTRRRYVALSGLASLHRRNGAAVRALDAGARIGNGAAYAEGEPRGGPEVLLDRVRNEKHELLSSNPDAVSVSKLGASLERASIELRPVSASQVFDRRLGFAEVDPHVPSRQHRIVDGHVTHRAATDDDFVAAEVYLL
jgi:hypothetical protein